MSQGQHVKELRKKLDLTLEKFGKPLGVGKTAISKIENGENGLTDQMIVSICREYNANEEWLRTGKGEMFIPLSRGEEISSFFGEVIREDDTFKKKLFSVVARLGERY